MHCKIHINMFPADTRVMGLINYNDDTSYRKENKDVIKVVPWQQLAAECQLDIESHYCHAKYS